MMKCTTSGRRACRPLLLVLAAGCAGASWSAPPMSVEAQAMAHWVHYTRLNLNRQHADAPFIVVDSEQLRWWLFDGRGRWSAQGPLPWSDPEQAAARLQPVLLAAPAVRPGQP